jgi:hypothetical protein
MNAAKGQQMLKGICAGQLTDQHIRQVAKMHS